MSRASREAESIAKADAYFEAIRRTPEPDWPQDTQVQPSVDQNIVPAEAAQSINIVPVAVLQRGAPSWSTEKFEEEHARREQEHRAQQQVISEAYYADPLNTDNPVPEQLLFAAAPTTTPNTEPELDAFYDSPNGELGTNRQVLARLDKGQRERFDATLSALFSIDTRDTTASLPEVGALPPEPLIERGKVVGDVPQAKPQTPAVHAFQESMGQGYHFVRAAAAQEAVAPSAPEVHKPDAAASLVTRIMGAATAPNTRSDIAEPAAMAGQLEHGSEPTAEGIITELRNQQEAPGETILERVLSGLRKSREQDLYTARQQRLREAAAIIDEHALIRDPRTVGEAVFASMGLTMALETDENGHKTQRVVRNPDGSVLLSTDLRRDSNESYLLRTKQGIRRFLGRVAGALGGNIRVSRIES